MPLAPIALFVYKRPEETRQTLEHLARNVGIEGSELFIFCDAARKPDEVGAVQATRSVVHGRSWCPRTTIIERQENRGLAHSVIAGVNELTESHGRVIVLEDDLLTSRGFLSYMNTALDRYQDSIKVMQISGHLHSIPHFPFKGSCSFLPMITSWGWATWKRAWEAFDPECNGWEKLKIDKKLRYRFDLDDSYPYFQMIKNQMEGKNDSWGIRWWWAVFQMNGISLYPDKTLVNNIGFGNGATHTTHTAWYVETRNWDPNLFIEDFPQFIQINERNWRTFKKFYRSHLRPSLFRRGLRKLGLVN
jgi:hypothetical protein